MTPEREEKFRAIVRKRQTNLTVILENVHDPHNIGAVLRTCDSVGVKEIFVLYTDERLKSDRLELGLRSSSGARKWVDVNFYTDAETCFQQVKKNYQNIFSTHLEKNAKTLLELDLTSSVALLFGNERDGLSEAALSYSNGNFIIPQVGMVQSLNISVACAVSLYEAFRQRKLKGFFDECPILNDAEQEQLYQDYARRHKLKINPNSVKRKND
jgi:tRNA (guanosine-2'-O-)-methyltransferase